VLALSFQVFIGTLPLNLTGRIPGFPWSLLPLLLIIAGIINAGFWTLKFLHGRDDRILLLLEILAVLVVLKLTVVFWGFWQALRRRLVSPRFVAGFVGLWVLVVVTVLPVILHTCNLHPIATVDPAKLLAIHAMMLKMAVILMLNTILAIPLARIALSPLALAMNRHR
jgi:hypothetical protein